MHQFLGQVKDDNKLTTNFLQRGTELRNLKHTYTFLVIHLNNKYFCNVGWESKVTYLVRRVTIIHQISKANTATEENNERKTSECQPHFNTPFFTKH